MVRMLECYEFQSQKIMSQSFRPVASLRGKSVERASQFNRSDIDDLCNLATDMRAFTEGGGVIDALRGKVMTPLFFENSSRTYSSFCGAMLKLGGGVVNLNLESSSIAKGETLSDTIRTMTSYSDVLVLRHPKQEALDTAVRASPVPVMNGGNGTGEHPTQGLLDILTIRTELGTVDGLVIALVGDLKNGRTVHSLSKLLVNNFDIVELILVAPDVVQMPQDVLDAFTKPVKITRATALSEEVVSRADVLYTTRLQKERFSSAEDAVALASFDTVKADLRIDANTMKWAKEKMVVMHPLPRVDELCTSVDDDPRAAYFRQMRFGLFMRMAILFSVLCPAA
jgi:aspartate carbamoyltransferase catalytic subunit